MKLEDCAIPERLTRLQGVDLASAGGHERLMKALRAVERSAAARAAPAEGKPFREDPFGISDLYEPGGLALDGYRVYQGLKLTRYSNAIDGSMLLLIDKRINGLAGGILKGVHPDVETLSLHLDPNVWSLKPGEIQQALLLVIDAERRIIYHEYLGRESARLDRVYLYTDRSKPTFIVTRDYSIGWGSYNGPISYFLEVSATAGIQYVIPHGLMNSLKTAWLILGNVNRTAEILSKKCRPDFAASNLENMRFKVIYERFHFEDHSWQSGLVEEPGFWEAVDDLDPAEIRAKFGITD